MEKPYVLKAGEEIERSALISKLFNLGYVRESLVSHPGEFAERGGTVDIYPVTYRKPVRITFKADEVESIRDFSPMKGKSFTAFPEVIIPKVTKELEKRVPRWERKLLQSEVIPEFFEIEKGDYVVHLKYGIGRFLGSKDLTVQGRKVKHLAIEYADREILYLEYDERKFLERYVGVEGKRPKLTKLHSKDWRRTKEKIRLGVRSLARDMLTLQAKRELLKGFKFRKDTDWQKQFEEEFPYKETPDQVRATKEVKSDMESKKPMDRLLCGDVGYGKTEVAMRAAFKAVMDAKQVAFLVPTTVLAEQHFLTLTDRVKSFPIRVEVLSRFRTKAEQKKIVEAVKKGAVDVVIGTHRLLSGDIEFKNLGLVIIDEEQRFGVKAKEKLKHMRELVDVLTLTATPIPRTLYLAMMGARDMSTISTPPTVRLPIETEIIDFEPKVIKKGFDREISRSGQIYFIHNRIKSIGRVRERLEEFLPDVKFATAHGRMPPKELEAVMEEFIKGKLDCLISTNIIESGIDIPNVNTIFINRADNFGLADLYQLRGRVGRFVEKRKAYAYLIVPQRKILTEDAERRLEAIATFTELGAGFRLALQDLEIRGAGNILGSEQSGFIYQIGFDLYCRFLQQAVEEEKEDLNV